MYFIFYFRILFEILIWKICNKNNKFYLKILFKLFLIFLILFKILIKFLYLLINIYKILFYLNIFVNL